MLNKEKVKMGVKLAIGGLLIFYVLDSKMVDFKILKTVLLNPLNLFISLAFLGFSTLCCAARWHLLVRAQGLSPSYKDLFSLTMIGNFFNTFMPGAVGGDVIKAWYIAGQEPKRKTKAIFTVLLDRVIGLAVIVFYSTFTLLLFRHWIISHPELRLVAYSLWSFTTLSIAIAVFFFSPLYLKIGAVASLVGFLRKNERLATVIDAGLLYRNHLPTIVKTVVLSAISVLATNLLYSIQGHSIGISMDLARYFFVVPVCITVSAIPILPGGIGVGQVAFFTLFQWVGMPPEQGATLCTLMQVYTILFNCLGAVSYVKFKRAPHGSMNSAPISMRRVGHLV